VRILVCVKRVPAPGARIGISEDELDVDSTHLGFTTSPHEECAVEAAVCLVEGAEEGGDVVVLTAGPAAAEEQLRYAASVGATELVLVPIHGGGSWDPQATARALTDSVTALETRDGPFDLILFGNESADAGGYQVGVRVAHAMGRPMVNGAKSIEYSDSVVTVRRATDGGVEIYEVPTPAVVGVREGINLPRYPTMRGRLASKKITITTIDTSPEAGGLQRRRLHRPAEAASEPIMLGSGPDAAAGVVDVLEELGLT